MPAGLLTRTVQCGLLLQAARPFRAGLIPVRVATRRTRRFVVFVTLRSSFGPFEFSRKVVRVLVFSLRHHRGFVRSVAILTVLVVLLTLIPSEPVEASVNLPLHHWTYEAIERLTDMGIIDRAMVATKPYSRKEAARYVARALERARKDQLAADGRETIAQPLLERLMREFRPELMDLNAVSRPSGSNTRPVRYGGRVTTEVDGFFVGGGQTVRLRENRGGEYYANGAVNQTDVRGWLELGDWFATVLQPKFISNEHILGIGATNNSQNFYLREGNAKFSLYNVALEIGRGTQWWGQGYRGTLLLSDHPYPLDMIKLYSDEPFKIPWLEGIGDWKIHSFLTRLEENRDFPRAKVFGMRISYMPADWLEMALTRLTQFNGRGHVGSFPETIIDNWLQVSGQPSAEVNEQAMLDLRARIPKVPYLVPFPAGMQFYMEIGLEDRIDHAAGLVGVYIPQVFQGDSLDFRFEFVTTDWERQVSGQCCTWYNSGTFTSGMRYRGYPLGHWVGTDGIDFFVRTTRRIGDQLVVGANVEYEERQRSLPVHEKKREASLDITYFFTDKIQFSVAYTYQRLNNPGQITNIKPFVETFTPIVANNNFVWTTLAIEF